MKDRNSVRAWLYLVLLCILASCERCDRKCQNHLGASLLQQQHGPLATEQGEQPMFRDAQRMRIYVGPQGAASFNSDGLVVENAWVQFHPQGEKDREEKYARISILFGSLDVPRGKCSDGRSNCLVLLVGGRIQQLDSNNNATSVSLSPPGRIDDNGHWTNGPLQNGFLQIYSANGSGDLSFLLPDHANDEIPPIPSGVRLVGIYFDYTSEWYELYLLTDQNDIGKPRTEDGQVWWSKRWSGNLLQWDNVKPKDVNVRIAPLGASAGELRYVLTDVSVDSCDRSHPKPTECGGRDQRCCASGRRCESGTGCRSGRCVGCPAPPKSQTVYTDTKKVVDPCCFGEKKIETMRFGGACSAGRVFDKCVSKVTHRARPVNDCVVLEPAGRDPTDCSCVVDVIYHADPAGRKLECEMTVWEKREDFPTGCPEE